MKAHSTHLLLTITTFAIVAATALAGNSKKQLQTTESNADKASYVFIEAVCQEAMGNLSEYYELINHAYALDSTNSIIAYYFGLNQVLMDGASLLEAEQGARLMRKHFDEHPDDFYEAYGYGRTASSLGWTDEAIRVWETLSTLYPKKLNVVLEKAYAYTNKGEYDKAIAAYDTLEASLGQSLQITLQKLALYQRIDSAGVITEAHKLYDAAPENAEFNLVLGTVMQEAGMGDSALYYFDRAIELAPDDGRAYMSKAQYYRAHGDSINFEKQIYNALISPGLDVETKVDVITVYIRHYFSSRDTSEKVVKLFEVLINQHPHESEIHDLYSQYFIVQQDYKHAAEQLQYVVDIDPADSQGWRQLMRVYLVDGNYQAVVETSEKALIYNPDDLELYLYIAPAFYQIEEYDRALNIYQTCLDKTSKDDYELKSDVYSGMGDVYYSLRDTTSAFSCYEKAIEFNPANILAMNNYAYFLAVEGVNLNKAEALSAKAVKGDPDNDTYLDTYAWVYFKKGEYTLALVYMEYALKNSDEPTYELWDHYGDILFMNGQFDKAVECWERALELNPDNELINKKVTNKTYFRQ